MNWQLEVFALIVTVCAVGGYLHFDEPFEEVPISTYEQFTAHDFAAFDRGFELGEKECVVGLEDSRICLGPSPRQYDAKIGQELPVDLPVLSAGMRILLALDTKDEGLKTVRFGQTLALIEPETRLVRDVMHLNAPNFDESRANPLQINAAP